MTDAQMKLADVTQADREAAADFFECSTFAGRDAFLRGDEDSSDVVQAFAKHRQATEARAQGLVDAAQTFTDRLKSIHEHPAYKSVWMVNQAHYGPYDPQYTDELEALETALATWRRT